MGCIIAMGAHDPFPIPLKSNIYGKIRSFFSSLHTLYTCCGLRYLPACTVIVIFFSLCCGYQEKIAMTTPALLVLKSQWDKTCFQFLATNCQSVSCVFSMAVVGDISCNVPVIRWQAPTPDVGCKPVSFVTNSHHPLFLIRVLVGVGRQGQFSSTTN